ncbi:MAG: hypothetical protein JST00_14635 [Deltaproteobacteria bacterium]|nr:hypothetical protein [Deltaproteobacteria bacterium]
MRVEDLVAAGFGHEEGTFETMTDASGVRVLRLGANTLRVDVPSEIDVGPAVVGCAWTHGTFVDLDLGVAVHFERAAEGMVAGVWLRSSASSGVCIMLSPDGRVSATVRRDDETPIVPLATVQARSASDANGTFVLRAKVLGEKLIVHRNGVVAMSVTCPTDIVGGAALVVQVPTSERGVVVFGDACARLP